MESFQNLLWLFLVLGIKEVKGKQNDWAVPRLDLSVCLIYVCDEAMACV